MPFEASPEASSSPNYLELDLNSPEMTELFSKAEVYYLAEAGKYSKKGQVHIRPAIQGEQVTTVLEDRSIETTNTAKEGQFVVTNPGGEEYIIGADKLVQRYQPTEEEGVFKARGAVRAFRNQTGRPIQITAPWGEPQNGDESCMLATPYDPEKPDEIDSDRYIIGHEEFLETYSPLEEVA